jgi:8-hydroxy-5-deazaflavin:NADPH oxidoreductase
MKIAVVGIGNVGRALAPNLKAAGHDVAYAVRDPLDPKYPEGDIPLKAMAEAGAWADAIILAVGWSAVDDALAALAPITGKILIDPTNAIDVQHDLAWLIPADTSAAEIIRGKTDARVVKAFNHVGAKVMAAAPDKRPRPLMFAASDDADARATVLGLIRDIGFDARDAGGLTFARDMESMGRLWIAQVFAHGMNGETAWTFVGADTISG